MLLSTCQVWLFAVVCVCKHLQLLGWELRCSVVPLHSCAGRCLDDILGPNLQGLTSLLPWVAEAQKGWRLFMPRLTPGCGLCSTCWACLHSQSMGHLLTGQLHQEVSPCAKAVGGLTMCMRAGGQPVLLQMGLAAASLLQDGDPLAQLDPTNEIGWCFASLHDCS